MSVFAVRFLNNHSRRLPFAECLSAQKAMPLGKCHTYLSVVFFKLPSDILHDDPQYLQKNKSLY